MGKYLSSEKQRLNRPSHLTWKWLHLTWELHCYLIFLSSSSSTINLVASAVAQGL